MTKEIDPLEWIATFHRLRARRRFHGRLTAEERRIHGFILEVFHPRRLRDGRFLREVLRLDVQRSALIEVSGRLVPSRVTALGLWRLELMSAFELAAGEDLVLGIETEAGPPRHWFVANVGWYDPVAHTAKLSFVIGLGRSSALLPGQAGRG